MISGTSGKQARQCLQRFLLNDEVIFLSVFITFNWIWIVQLYFPQKMSSAVYYLIAVGFFSLCCCLLKFLFAFSRVYISCCRNDMSSVAFFLCRFYAAKKIILFHFRVYSCTLNAHTDKKKFEIILFCIFVEIGAEKTIDMSKIQKLFDWLFHIWSWCKH